MKDIRIFSEKEFLIEINSSSYEINENKYIMLHNPTSFVLKVFPIEQQKESLPYAIKIDTTLNKISSPNECIKIYKLNNSYDIFVYPFLISSSVCLFTNSHLIKNTKYTISCYTDRVEIFSNDGKYTYETELNNCSSSESEKYIFILSKLKNYKKLIIFNTNSCVFSQIYGTQIEINKKEIKCLTPLNDSLNHYKLTTYSLSNMEIKDHQLYIKSKAKNSTLNKVIICNFIDCLKVQDYDNANLFLKNKLPSNSLAQFFGAIDCYRVEEDNIVTIYNNIASQYKFDILEGKIIDIENL